MVKCLSEVLKYNIDFVCLCYNMIFKLYYNYNNFFEVRFIFKLFIILYIN